MPSTILPPKEYAQQVSAIKARLAPIWREDGRAKVPSDEDRMARNVLTSEKIFERADRGILTDLRELVALRLAPWLKAAR